MIDRLTPMRLSLAVEAGRRWSRDRLVLARTDVDLVADRTTTVHLACELPPAPPPVPLAGTLVVPPEWEIERPSLRIEMLDRPFDSEWTSLEIASDDLVPTGAPGPFRWDAGEVLPGEFVAVVRLGARERVWSTRFDVGPAGDRDVQLHVPPPARLLVHFEGTDGVHWWLHYLCGPIGPAAHGTKLYEDPEAELRVPIGDVRLSAWAGGARTRQRVVRAVAGTTEVTLPSPGNTGVRVHTDGESPFLGWRSYTHQAVGLPPEGVRVTRVDGAASPTGWDSGPVTFLFDAPGRYEVALDTPEGEAPTPPRIVDVPAGEIVDVVFSNSPDDG